MKYSSRLRTNDNPSSMRLIISSENLQMELEKIISLMSDVTTYRRTCADVRLPYDLKQQIFWVTYSHTRDYCIYLRDGCEI